MSADDEESQNDEPFKENTKADKIDNQSEQARDSISIGNTKDTESEDPEKEKEQSERQSNKEDPPASEKDNGQINSTNTKSDGRIAKNSEVNLIFLLYLIGLISLSVAALGFCFASFTEYAYTQYQFIITRNFQWVWICAIIAVIIFFIDFITLFILKGTKRIKSLKRLLLAKFSIPLATSVIICIIVGLVGGKMYYNHTDANYKADNFYISEALQQANGNSGSNTNNSSVILIPDHVASDAVTAVTLAATCTKYETKSQISNDDLTFTNNPEDGGPFIIASGATTLDPIMNCIMSTVHMPSSVETELETDISQAVSTLQESQNSNPLTQLSGLKSINTSWNLQDGSTLYLSYGPPAIPLGSWSAVISTSKSILSGASSSNSSNLVGQSSASSAGSTNTNGNSSSSPTNSNTTNQKSSYQNALMAIESTTTACSTYETQNEISDDSLSFIGPASGGPEVDVSGTNTWDPMMTCVAKQLYMPTSVESELKSAIVQAVSAINGNTSFSSVPMINTSWSLSDGSKIYLGFSGAADSAGSWVASFGITNQEY